MNRGRRSDRIRPVATLLGLLAAISLSGAASAATFTLLELQTGSGSVAGFTIGNLEFFDFDTTATSVGPALITIETVESESVPGFVVNGNGNWSAMGDDSGALIMPQFLDFTFKVRTIDPQPMIGGATLWANDYSIENGTALALGLTDGGLVDLEVLIAEPFGLPITNLDLPIDSVNLNPREDALMLESTMAIDVLGSIGPQGPGELNSYTMLFPVVVPEPGTALLMGLGIAGLGVFGRPRR